MPSDLKLNDGLGGTQILYADYNWNSTASDLVYRGYEQYSQGYDGYTFFQQMAWNRLQKEGDARGLFTEIPTKGYSGWVCYLTKSALWGETPEYKCMSKFIPRFSLQRYKAPDLKDDLSYPGGGWFCEVVFKEQY